MASSWSPDRHHPHTAHAPSRNGASRPATLERTYEELYEEAKRRKISGRSKMSKTELERALGGR